MDVIVHTIVRSLISNFFLVCNNKNNNSFLFFTIISVETNILLIRLHRVQRKRVTTSFQDTSMILLALENCTVFNITNDTFPRFRAGDCGTAKRGEVVKRLSQYWRQNKSRPLTARRFRAQRFRQLGISSGEISRRHRTRSGAKVFSSCRVGESPFRTKKKT